MQKLTRLFVILPCHSLEDFPTHHTGAEAANLLSNWTALWHPALIAACGRKPDWQRADYGDFRFDLADDETCIALLPTISEHSLDPELVKKLDQHNADPIKNLSNRAEIVQKALASIEDLPEGYLNVSEKLANDFHGLGYAFLQTQIMTRQLRYSSNLDEERFSEVVVAAANAAVEGNDEQAETALVRCFDLLLEEKNGYYPVQPELLDVVLTAPTTLGKSLNDQLGKTHRQNLLLTGRNAKKLAEKQPETAEKMREQIAAQNITLVGGLEDELPTNLVSSETMLNQLLKGRSTIQELFGVTPSVFIRRRFGLSPSIPAMLDQLNFIGSVHATLDDGKFPRGTSCNIRWTGDDDHSVLSFGDVPLSAEESGSFLGLGVAIGEAIDSAHVSAVLFVHWPNRTCESFEDLIRISRYSPLFGNFLSFDEYFESVYDPGYGDTFTADEYRTPFFKQAVEAKSANPISTQTNYWNRFHRISAAKSLLTQACIRLGLKASVANEIQTRLADLQSETESALNIPADSADLDSAIDQVTADISALFREGNTEAKAAETIEFVNTTPFKRRVSIESKQAAKGSVKLKSNVVYAEGTDEGTNWVIDVPSMGRTTLRPAEISQHDDLRKDASPLEGRILRNEFFQLEVDENSGGIRSIQLYGKRINLGGQQLSLRIPAEKDARDQPLTKARYAKMIAKEFQTNHSQIFGEITTRGDLVDSDSAVATFCQTVRVTRGMRTAEVSIEIEPLIKLSGSQNHYFCSRLAWQDESARVIANSHESKYDVSSDWFHATQFFDVVQDLNRLTMLTGGLPYHRRATRRMVDTVLIAGEERQRKFKFGLAIDTPYPLRAAINRSQPLIEIPNVANSETAESSWLVHIDSRNVLATSFEPIFEGDGKCTGLTIRLRETEGRSGSAKVSCPRIAKSAEKTDLSGEFIQSLEVVEEDQSRVQVEFARFEFFQIKIHWDA